MRKEILGKNYSPSEKLKEVVVTKLSKLDKYFDDDAVAKVVCYTAKNGEKHIMEVTINLDNKILRAEETTDNMYNNIDLIIPKLTRQIRKYRTKLSKKVKEDVFVQVGEPKEDDYKQIVRKKSFELVPMTEDEAIESFELIDHDFYVYLSKETGRVNVLYRRDDGDYGLLDFTY
ncbi:MAG: ribosome-associated translation inhibitor RaiA [Clostridia bacterium]|nr:ribosome-associated translation inhibitor RaiA [Clostridia bacterium]MDY5264673.1 ribosome-associated translation inhibitor RaiA [Eubacteriales bacterium]MDY5439685.1 ribosome-associated translation inhibitor RaiA [Eubacteriales bacterium]